MLEATRLERDYLKVVVLNGRHQKLSHDLQCLKEAMAPGSR